MQDRSSIEEALESARNELQPGERILTVGKTIVSADMRYTQVAMIAFITTFAITISGVFLITYSPFVIQGGLFIFIGIWLSIFFFYCLFLGPLIDLYRKFCTPRVEEICVVTTQRVLTIRLKSCILTEVAKKTEIAKIQSEKERLTLTMSDGSKKKMKIIEGLRLLEIPTF